jgi:N-methylhydantoinase A
MREYERWTTTIVNAYTRPLVDRYLGALETGLAARGFRGSLFIMTSSGGTATPATARRYPVRLIESGPAAGALMCAHLGLQMADAPALLSFDMGGTTAKGALIRDRAPLRKHELEVARVHAFKKGSGLPLKIPAIDMIEIGAGGGGIAAIDRRGVIQLGPRSAGAVPGPACYGRGGAEPTLTDANLLLGYLDPAFFLGGDMALDSAASRAAVTRVIGGPLALAEARAAWGIHETANEDVARAFRVHAAERGFDYRGCMMIAFGGCGPLQALRIARKLRVPQVMFPGGAGVMSAIGLLVSPLSHEVMWSDRILLEDLTADGFERRFAGPTAEAVALLGQAGLAPRELTVGRRLDMRYRGQGYEIEVVLPDGVSTAELLRTLPERFAEQYARVFSISFLNQPLEIVNWKLEVTGPRPIAGTVALTVGNVTGGAAAAAGTAALKGTRRAYFPSHDGFVDCPVYDRYALAQGATLVGPALVEENEATCVIGDGDRVTVDEAGNLIATVYEARAAAGEAA